MDYAHFILQLAVILLAAKTLGRAFSRRLKQPRVLGELFAGMLIGPYALGGISILGMRPLFSHVEGLLPVSTELHSLMVLGSVVLLFAAGLETDLGKFLRYSGAGLATAFGGAIVPFVLGDALVVWFGLADGYLSPAALMMGTVALATSVGITTAVLSERRRLDSAEGATILSAAVIDDIFGLVVLAMVLNLIAHGPAGKASVDWGKIAAVALKAGLFWVVTMTLCILGARYIGRFLKSFGGPAAVATVALAMALFLAALAEKAGLALIIGAYIMGLSLSRLDMIHELQRRIAPIYDFLVPVFFCVMGMMVDFRRFHGVALFGSVYAVAAIGGKLIGCGAGAYPLGFNLRGALRIGMGMAPRQEVAVIVAGTALAAGAIKSDLYSAAVLMTFVSTAVTPPILKHLFDDRPGLRREEKERKRPTARLRLKLAGPELATLVSDRMARAFRQEEFFVHRREELGLYEMRKDQITVFLRVEDSALEFTTQPDQIQYVRFVVLEEMIALREAFQEASQLMEMDELRRSLLGTSGNECRREE